MPKTLELQQAVCPVCFENDVEPGDEMCEDCMIETESMLADKALFRAEFGIYTTPDDVDDMVITASNNYRLDHLAYLDLVADRDESGYAWH